MVDVGEKNETDRWAVAGARVRMSATLVARIAENATAKGDVLAVARIAGIMAAKKTAELIPLCHPVRLCAVAVTSRSVRIASTCEHEPPRATGPASRWKR